MLRTVWKALVVHSNLHCTCFWITAQFPLNHGQIIMTQIIWMQSWHRPYQHTDLVHTVTQSNMYYFILMFYKCHQQHNTYRLKESNTQLNAKCPTEKMSYLKHWLSSCIPRRKIIDQVITVCQTVLIQWPQVTGCSRISVLSLVYSLHPICNKDCSPWQVLTGSIK